MSDIRRILVAIKDPWAPSLPAMEKAAQLARALGAKIRLFHAMSEPLYIDVSQANGYDLPQMQRTALGRPAGDSKPWRSGCRAAVSRRTPPSTGTSRRTRPLSAPRGATMRTLSLRTVT